MKDDEPRDPEEMEELPQVRFTVDLSGATGARNVEVAEDGDLGTATTGEIAEQYGVSASRVRHVAAERGWTPQGKRGRENLWRELDVMRWRWERLPLVMRNADGPEYTEAEWRGLRDVWELLDILVAEGCDNPARQAAAILKQEGDVGPRQLRRWLSGEQAPDSFAQDALAKVLSVRRKVT